MRLISSAELCVGHFLRTESCRRSHACANLQNLKKATTPETLGHKLIAFGDKEAL